MASRWTYTKGLHEIGQGNWAYLMPDGTWGWSNAGLIVDGDQSLLVDTLFDLPLTHEMLTTMRDAVPAAGKVDTLVNTHADGDHTFGNSLLPEARVITTESVAERIVQDGGDRLVRLRESMASESDGGRFIREVFGHFQHAGIVRPAPTDTFVGERTLHVGDKEVRLIDVGPAHTFSDTLVHVPADRVLYTGDILFVGMHPAIWAGPIGNWIAACEKILALDVDVIVPGHGPIVDKAAVRRFADYLRFFYDEGRKRHEAGLNFAEAAFDMQFGPFSDWHERERVVINMYTLFRELDGAPPEPPPSVELWQLMGRYHFHLNEHSCATCAAGSGGH